MPNVCERGGEGMIFFTITSLIALMVAFHVPWGWWSTVCVLYSSVAAFLAAMSWLTLFSRLQYLEDRVKTLEHIGRSRAYNEMTSTQQHPATDEEQTPAPSVKIGDYVWVYDEFMWGLIPCQVDRPYHCRCGEDGGCTFETFFADCDFGKTVFLTREEAEAALAEREGKG